MHFFLFFFFFFLCSSGNVRLWLPTITAKDQFPSVLRTRSKAINEIVNAIKKESATRGHKLKGAVI